MARKLQFESELRPEQVVIFCFLQIPFSSSFLSRQGYVMRHFCSAVSEERCEITSVKIWLNLFLYVLTVVLVNATQPTDTETLPWSIICV